MRRTKESVVTLVAQPISDTVGDVHFVPATPSATAQAARQTSQDGLLRVIVDPFGDIAGFTFLDERGRCMWRAYPGHDFGLTGDVTKGRR